MHTSDPWVPCCPAPHPHPPHRIHPLEYRTSADEALCWSHTPGGGTLALNLLTGACARSPPNMGVGFCGSRQPGVRNVSASSATCTTNRSQQQLSKDLLLGVVVWEGFIPKHGDRANGSYQVVPMDIPAGTFVLFMAGQYNKYIPASWELTSAPQCSCAGFARFPGLSHFGANNWQGPGTHQVTPCAIRWQSDPINYTVSEQLQKEAIQLEAQLIDDFLRAVALRQRLARQRLKQLAARRMAWQPPTEAGAEGNGSTVSTRTVSQVGPQGYAAYDLHLKGSCF